ncbi:MAG: hypothetical protein PHW01_03885 [Patescibacteria group bacterium]|nr:hypothetical protein [Patescibacteria group bacterium]
MSKDPLESYRMQIGEALRSLHIGEMTAEEFRRSIEKIINQVYSDPVVQNNSSLHVDGLKQYAATVSSSCAPGE